MVLSSAADFDFPDGASCLSSMKKGGVWIVVGTAKKFRMTSRSGGKASDARRQSAKFRSGNGHRILLATSKETRWKDLSNEKGGREWLIRQRTANDARLIGVAGKTWGRRLVAPNGGSISNAACSISRFSVCTTGCRLPARKSRRAGSKSVCCQLPRCSDSHAATWGTGSSPGFSVCISWAQFKCGVAR